MDSKEIKKLVAREKRITKLQAKLIDELNVLADEHAIIFQQLEMTNRKGHKVVIKEETWGRGKNKRQVTVGRHYYYDTFLDADDNQPIKVERNYIVSIDGKYHNRFRQS